MLDFTVRDPVKLVPVTLNVLLTAAEKCKELTLVVIFGEETPLAVTATLTNMFPLLNLNAAPEVWAPDGVKVTVTVPPVLGKVVGLIENSPPMVSAQGCTRVIASDRFVPVSVKVAVNVVPT